MRLRDIAAIVSLLVALAHGSEGVKAGVNFKFESLQIPGNKADSGEVCDGGQGACDPYFTVCFAPNCDNPVKTGHVVDVQRVTFESKIGDTPNPIFVPIANLEDGVEGTVKVYDRNPGGTDVLLATRTFKARAKTLMDEGGAQSLNLGDRGQITLRARMTFSCAKGETDPVCSVCHRRNPCQNKGKCLPAGAGFECKCRSGYSGKVCEKTAGQCSADFCPIGNCRLGHGLPFCWCPEFRRGPKCEKQLLRSGVQVRFESIRDTAGKLLDGQPCNEGGGCNLQFRVCVDRNQGTKKCLDRELLSDYFEGAQRNFHFGEALGDKTKNPMFFQTMSLQPFKKIPVEVQVLEHSAAGEPKVRATFTGHFTGTDVENGNSKELVYKENGITLTARVSFICDPAINAYPCEKEKADPCANVECSHGKCVPNGDTGKCLCDPGYEGDRCHLKKKNPCDPNPCQNGGVCNANADGSFTCFCSGNFAGSKCEKNLCEPNPCNNGGQCQVSGGEVACRCPSGWTGPTCEKKKTANSCDNRYCNNNGQCRRLSRRRKVCDCNPHYHGRRCGDKDACADKPCKNGGSCAANEDDLTKYVCECKKGFKGTNCEESAAKCKPGVCGEHGKCLEDPPNDSYKCKCSVGYEGKHCEEQTKYCPKTNTCSGHGKCVENHKEASYSCECDKGYEGKDCEDKTKFCKPDSCANDGECEEDHPNLGFTCKCKKGFEGKRCRKKVQYCPTSDACSGHGTCKEQHEKATYTCACDKGYEGRDCEQKTKYCPKENACSGHGKCEEKHAAANYECKCDKGYEGKDCEKMTKYCKPDQCKNGGTCVEEHAKASSKCDCKKGYEGEDCSETTKYCPKTNPCSGHGTCVEKHKEATYECQCNKGYEGKDCEDKTKYCKPDSCKNGGRCVEEHANAKFSCECGKGYEGADCGQKTKYCPKKNVCSEHGQCVEMHKKADYRCQCDKGYQGKDCEDKTKYCPKENTCSGHGKCKELHKDADYQCSCDKGYQGKDCDEETKYCPKTNACSGHGKCEELHADAAYKCSCVKGYVGKDCEEKRKYCPAKDACSNNGACKELHASHSYKCDCNKGFEGKDCEKETKFCRQGLCENGGTCEEDRAKHSYKCKCKRGFVGRRCRKRVKYCPTVNPCSGHGRCEERFDQATYKCECNAGYEGRDCESQTKYCKKGSCKNGGLCVERHAQQSFRCECAKGYEGKDCGTETKYCPKENACSGNGQCDEDHASARYTCVCNDGFVGEECETAVVTTPPPVCQADTCANGGQCEEKEGRFSCRCRKGYTGRRCRKKKPALCPEGACSGQGSCETDGKAERCHCNPGFAGKRCERIIATTAAPGKLGEGYCLSLLLKQYSNEESRRIDGDFCDGNPFIKTLRYSACDVLFKICVAHSREKCQTTDFIKDKDVVTYGPMIGKTKNPLIFHLNKVSERIDIKVGAMDDDFSTDTDKIDDYESDKNSRNLMKDYRPITFTHKVGSLLAMAKIFCCDAEKCGGGPKPTGTRCIQVTLLRFADPNGMRADGSACDSFLGTTFSTSKCDPVFEVCLNDKCQKRSKAAHNKNELRYEQIRKLTEPYIAQVSYQRKKVQLAVNVFEFDTKSKTDVIARFSQEVQVSGKSGHVDLKSKFVTMRASWQEVPCGSEPTCPPTDKVRECRNDGKGFVVMTTEYEKQKDGSCSETHTPGSEPGPCEPTRHR